MLFGHRGRRWLDLGISFVGYLFSICWILCFRMLSFLVASSPMVTVGVTSRRLYPLVRCRLPTNDCGTALSGVFHLECVVGRTVVFFFTARILLRSLCAAAQRLARHEQWSVAVPPTYVGPGRSQRTMEMCTCMTRVIMISRVIITASTK